MPDKKELRYTHVSNFYDSAMDSLRSAWDIHLSNIESKSYNSGKKSHAESGHAALAILIMVMKFEADIRLIYDRKTERSDVDSRINPRKLLKRLVELRVSVGDGKFNFEKYDEYLDEILLVRNIIAHGYIYEGAIHFDDDWEVTSIEGTAVTGRDRSVLNDEGITPKLNIETSPYRIGVFDALIVNRVIENMRLMTGLPVRADLISDGSSHVELSKWISSAKRGINKQRDDLLDELKTEYYSIMAMLYEG